MRQRIWVSGIVIASAALLTNLGCGSLPATHGCNHAACAIAGTAIAVAAVGVHRAATGACWGMCGPGLVCDRPSGLCVAGECYPRCAGNESCERTTRGLACVPGTSAGFTMTTLPATNSAPVTNAFPAMSPATPQTVQTPLAPLPAVNAVPPTSANPSLPPLVQQ